MKYYIELRLNKDKNLVGAFDTIREAEKWYRENIQTDATLISEEYEILKKLTRKTKVYLTEYYENDFLVNTVMSFTKNTTKTYVGYFDLDQDEIDYIELHGYLDGYDHVELYEEVKDND